MHLFSLVPHASVFPWDQGALFGRWNHCTMLLGCLFSFLQKVSGQQTLYECIKNDFFQDLLFTSMLKKNQIQKGPTSMDPKMFATKFFFRERFFYFEFFYCSPFFSEKLNKVEIKLPKHSKEVFWHYTHCDPWKVIYAFFACRAIFFLVKCVPGLVLSLVWI